MKVSTTTSVVGLSQLLSGQESGAVVVVVVVVSPRQIFDPGCIIDGHGSEAEVWGHAGMVIDCNTTLSPLSLFYYHMIILFNWIWNLLWNFLLFLAGSISENTIDNVQHDDVLLLKNLQKN